MFNYNKINTLIDRKQQEDKQITVAQIASGIGLSDPGLRNIKTGKSVPSVEMLEKIADYFGVDMNYFFSAAELKDYLAEKPKHMVLNESNSDYVKQTNSIDKMLDKIFEQQAEIVELNVELERLKNGCVRDKNAQAG